MQIYFYFFLFLSSSFIFKPEDFNHYPQSSYLSFQKSHDLALSHVDNLFSNNYSIYLFHHQNLVYLSHKYLLIAHHSNKIMMKKIFVSSNQKYTNIIIFISLHKLNYNNLLTNIFLYSLYWILFLSFDHHFVNLILLGHSSIKFICKDNKKQ